MPVYRPDPWINTGVILDAIEAERADLAAGYPPRRWRCIPVPSTLAATSGPSASTAAWHAATPALRA